MDDPGRWRVKIEVTVDVDGDSQDDAEENATLAIKNGVNNGCAGYNQQMIVRDAEEIDE